MKDIQFVTVSDRRCEGSSAAERTNLRFDRREKAKAEVQPERVREFEAERAKLNDGDVGLQDERPKPTGAKKAKAGVQPERVREFEAEVQPAHTI